MMSPKHEADTLRHELRTLVRLLPDDALPLAFELLSPLVGPGGDTPGSPAALSFPERWAPPGKAAA